MKILDCGQSAGKTRKNSAGTVRRHYEELVIDGTTYLFSAKQAQDLRLGERQSFSHVDKYLGQGQVERTREVVELEKLTERFLAYDGMPRRS